VLNKAEAIHKVADKAAFRMLLDEHELCPATWDDITEWRENRGEGKYILRPRHHHQGRRFHVVEDFDVMEALCHRYGHRNIYIGEYIPKVAEYRVCVVSGRVAWVAQKTPADPKAYAWNVAKGGRFDNVRWDDWPLKVVQISIKAFDLSGLDFGGVDVMVDAEGMAYVLEINSAPSLTSPYRQECMAKVFDYIHMNGKDYIPRIEKRGGYRKFIHPAISNRVHMI
tara:strand:- start:605 stop:1279 length:675 start_codon:yes stop_codon:yes gene_type:complete